MASQGYSLPRGRSFLLRGQKKQNQRKVHPILPYLHKLNYFYGVVENSLTLKHSTSSPIKLAEFVAATNGLRECGYFSKL
jgi:hypothetical protein